MGSRFVSLDDGGEAKGAVVVLDVLRAFTTAAVAFERGAQLLVLTSATSEAFALRQENPEWLLMGEEGGLPIEGFDLSNSPAELEGAVVEGRVVVHRTTSGTRAVALLPAESDPVFCGSLVCARATAAALVDAPDVTYVISGRSLDRSAIDDGDDDLATAELIEAMRTGAPPDIDGAIARVTRSPAAGTLRSQGLPERDIEVSVEIDRNCPAMVIERRDGRLLLRPGFPS